MVERAAVAGPLVERAAVARAAKAVAKAAAVPKANRVVASAGRGCLAGRVVASVAVWCMAAEGMEGALGYGLALGQTVAAAAWIPERVVAVLE